MSNQKISIRNKRMLAWLLIACLIVSDSPLTSLEIRAEGEPQTSATIACTLVPKVEAGGIEYTIPDSYISVIDSSGSTVDRNSDKKYDLTAGADYQCVIKGAEMLEHTVDFIAPATAGDIDIEGDASKIQLVYDNLDTFYVDETRTPVNDLGITWTWTSGDSRILSVDTNGVVTGKSNGTTTVTRTSSTASADDTPCTNEAYITIVGEGKYSLNYKYCNQELPDDGRISITIKDSADNIVEAGEGSQYTFTWGEIYTYEIAEQNGIAGTSGKFQPARDQMSVDIPVVLALPVFTLEEKDLSADSTQVKSEEKDIAITCDNAGSLYNHENWEIQINDGEKKKVDSTDVKIDTNESVTIKYYYNNEQVKSYSVTTFSSYKVNYYYDGTAIALEAVEFNGGETVNQFKANNTYTLEGIKESGLEFAPPDPNTYTVTPKYTEESYDIHLQNEHTRVTQPKIEVVNRTQNEADEYEFTYGDTIEVKMENVSSYLNGGQTGWQWSCQNGSNSLSGTSEYDKSRDILTYRMDLEGETEGTYTLKYAFANGEVSSNEIKIRIKKIKLYVSSLPSIKKTYDGNNEFEYTLSLNSGYFKDQHENAISYDNEITLECIVSGSDAGEYDNIQIKKADVDNGSAFDTSGLVGKEGGYTVNKAVITKANVKLNIDNLYLYYMDQTGDPVQSKFSEAGTNIYGDSIDDSLKQVIFNHLGKPAYIDDASGRCSFNTEKLTFDNKNIICTITGGTSFVYSPQILNSSRAMQNKINITQQQLNGMVTVNTESEWINGNDLQVNFNDLGTSVYGKYYNKITYKELACKDGVIEIDTDVSGDKNIPIKLQQSNEDTYYGIILSKDGKYKTLALIIRIVAEQNKDNTYEATIEGDNDVTYSVVNLYLDASEEEVVFEDGLWVEGGNNIEKLDFSSLDSKAKYKEQGQSIGFEIQNIVSSIASIRYGFAEFTGEKLDSDSIDWKELEEETSSQSVELHLDDGNYIMYVEVTDKVGNRSIYASKGFVVDSTDPELKCWWKNKDQNKGELISGEESAERIYKNEKKEKEVVIKVIEENIANVDVTVSATNRKGESVLTEEQLHQMEDNITNAINEKKIYTFNADRDPNTLADVKDANYTIDVEVEDMNGKSAHGVYKFTIDTQAPEAVETSDNQEGKAISIAGFFGKIEAENAKEKSDKEKGIIKIAKDSINEVWGIFKERVFKIFANTPVTVTLSAEDSISDVKIFYLMADKKYTEQQLEKMEDSEWTLYEPDNKPKTKLNQREFVYMRAVDQAGNKSYFNSEGIITDTMAPDITPKVLKEANANKFYSGDVTIHVDVTELTKSTQAGASGLQYVGYRVESDGKVTESKSIIDKTTSETEKSFDIRLNGQKHNRNDVKVYITAVDNAGNMDPQDPISLKIDSAKPEISVTYNDEKGSQYYNHTRTATISIKERNLDTGDVDINIRSEHGSKPVIGKWSHTDNVGKSDDAVYTCQVTFDADDDYEFSVDCVDKAGNKAVKAFSDKFTIDKTVPEISVSYSNGQIEENGYYNEAVTATIAIEEHNFDAGRADIRINSEDGVASSSGFSNNGDTHTASVMFDRDGVYSLQVSFMDEAGNEAEAYQGTSFNIDLKDPEILINNVKDKSANSDDVKPVIICTDENYDRNLVNITVRGSNSGETSLEKLGIESRSVANGEEFSLTFPKEEAMDDVYTLTAKMEDKAGNETEDSIQFSVNRYGSVYTLGTETGEWLNSGECSYIKEGKPVVIIETNVDKVVECNIAYMAGTISAEKVEVKELADCSDEEKSKGAYYEAKEMSTGNGWYQYQYTVSDKNFTKEGKYSIQIDSVDDAGNHTSNVTSRHSENELEILFAVDQTAPSAVVTGAENGASYSESSHTVFLDVQDNLALNTVSVYLNGEEYAAYDAEEISELENGLIPVVVEESVSTQTIQVKAEDVAGNVLGRDVDGKYDAEFEDFELLVNHSMLVRMMYSYWIFIILALVAAGAIIAIAIVKHKNKEIQG